MGSCCHHALLYWRVTLSHFTVDKTEDSRGYSFLFTSTPFCLSVSVGARPRVVGMTKHRMGTPDSGDGQQSVSHRLRARGGHCTSRRPLRVHSGQSEQVTREWGAPGCPRGMRLLV